MPPGVVCKTVHQFNQRPIPDSDMEKLVEIAQDYRKVKDYVYQRFGRIGSLPKLYPGYTIQNEMGASGLREQLGMPSVYFYLAVFDALGDIKSQWARTKAKIIGRLKANEGFTEADRHYLRFVMKVNNAWAAVLNGREVELKAEFQEQYRLLAKEADTERLNRYLCRQVRKCHTRMHTASGDIFTLSERAYRYGDHGIYISIKEKRKRVFIPLTDSRQFQRQLKIKLYPQEKRLSISIPVDVTVRIHPDYSSQVGLAAGMYTMFTTDQGHRYGEAYGTIQSEYAGWLHAQAVAHSQNRGSSPGRKKYNAKKHRYEEQLHSYINHEINRMIQTEKPQVIYIPKLPKPQAGGVNKQVNRMVSLWQRGYIRRRLYQKCQEESVRVVEVLGKNISRECSRCGAGGEKKDGEFLCAACGWHGDEKMNAAQNAKNRGQGDGWLR